VPLYFAYGSNLHWPQMRRRCPSSRVVGRATLADQGITLEVAYIADLLFNVSGGVREDNDLLEELATATAGYAAAGYAALRRELAARASMGAVDAAAARTLVRDLLPAAIQRTRRYQTLQALINCTRRSLLPDPDVSEAVRSSWREEIHRLEAEGER